MQFSRIKLENWRNFGEVDVPVATRVFLVGANASGKSNFLDALRFLRELVVPGGGFQKAVQDRGGVSTIRNLAARQNPLITIEVDLSEGDDRLWRYRLVINQQGRRPVLREEKVWNEADELILNRPDSHDIEDQARLGQTQLEQVFGNRGFRDISNFFSSINYFHIVPQLVREPERTAAGYKNDPYGSDFLEQIASFDKRSQKARLSRIQDVLRVLVPQLAEVELWRDGSGVPHLRGKYQHWRPHGVWQTEREFSDGTLRLIGLVWALQDGRGPLLLEEPELSLHPGVVLRMPQLLYTIQRSLKRSRQTFISTHSPELLQDEGIGAHEILLLITSKEGTVVFPGASNEMIFKELEAGLTMADIVMPLTAPDTLTQLALL